jgi:prepilin-type N-terminal cleavage/methylation domain-containing protein
MKLAQLIRSASPARSRAGMTLIELMISMTLLTVIILGLYSMFDQTQKAMIRGSEQVDIQETARTAFRVILEELDQATASYKPGATNFYFGPNTNAPFFLKQGLIGNQERAHFLQDFFFLTRETNQWKLIGYFVRANATVSPSLSPNTQPVFPDVARARPADATAWSAGVGSLYRYEHSVNYLLADQNHLQTNFANFLVDDLTHSFHRNSMVTNVTKVADGIVHMRLKGFTNNTLVAFGDLANNVANIFLTETNRNIPSHIELEIGVLEPSTLQQARLIPSTFAVSNYLYRASGNVLMLRARVPLRIQSNNRLQ